MLAYASTLPSLGEAHGTAVFASAVWKLGGCMDNVPTQRVTDGTRVREPRLLLQVACAVWATVHVTRKAFMMRDCGSAVRARAARGSAVLARASGVL